MWKEQLPSLQDEEGARPSRIRSTIEGAVSFWQDWLQRMHERWDGQDSLVLVPRVEYTTLPPTAYADTVPSHVGTSMVAKKSGQFLTRQKFEASPRF